MGDVLPVKLEVERDGQDDGDEGAKRGTKERAHGVEGREGDGDDEEDEDDDDADEATDAATDELGPAAGGGVAAVGGVWLVDAKDDVGGGDEGSGIEGDLGEGDDGDEDAHEDSHGLGIALRLEDVGGDGVADAVAEHEDADDSQTRIKDILEKRSARVLLGCRCELLGVTYGEGESNLDSLTPFLRVAHVTVDLNL